MQMQRLNQFTANQTKIDLSCFIEVTENLKYMSPRGPLLFINTF